MLIEYVILNSSLLGHMSIVYSEAACVRALSVTTTAQVVRARGDGGEILQQKLKTACRCGPNSSTRRLTVSSSRCRRNSFAQGQILDTVLSDAAMYM